MWWIAYKTNNEAIVTVIQMQVQFIGNFTNHLSKITTRVESPIYKHILMIENFSIFFSFFNQIDQFLCHRTCKLEGYKCSLVKEQHKKHKKTISDSLLQKFWKTKSSPLSNSNIISSSFSIHFELFKTWWVCQPRSYKTSLHSTGKDAIVKDSKLEILL